MSQTKSIGIVGGGIAGLVAAWQLRKRLPAARIVIMESGDRLGGFLQTEHIDGYLIDTSADMFTTEPPTALEFCRQLGREPELIATRPVSQRAYIATTEGIVPVPAGFSLMLPSDLNAVANSDLLDEAGKQRFLQEGTVPARTDSADESLESFAVRRFGQQVFERLIQPLVSGIYTADPKLLSMQATMARFIAMEKQHGSLIAAAKSTQRTPSGEQAINADQTASGARYDLFRAPAHGMGQLIDWIVEDLGSVDVRTNCDVQEVSQVDQGWLVTAANRAAQRFDKLIIATPSAVVARILAGFDPELAKALSSIERASCAIVVFGFNNSQLQQDFSGYGIVVPACLNRQLIAASFSSNKFSGRAPADKILIRCFVGGALQAELVDLPDDNLIELANRELNLLVPVSGRPELARVYRWKQAMPQYHVGHLERVQRIETLAAAHSGLEIIGNSYRGVGIPVCIDCGQSAANRVVEQLTESVS